MKRFRKKKTKPIFENKTQAQAIAEFEHIYLPDFKERDYDAGNIKYNLKADYEGVDEYVEEFNKCFEKCDTCFWNGCYNKSIEIPKINQNSNDSYNFRLCQIHLPDTITQKFFGTRGMDKEDLLKHRKIFKHEAKDLRKTLKRCEYDKTKAIKAHEDNFKQGVKVFVQRRRKFNKIKSKQQTKQKKTEKKIKKKIKQSNENIKKFSKKKDDMKYILQIENLLNNADPSELSFGFQFQFQFGFGFGFGLVSKEEFFNEIKALDINKIYSATEQYAAGVDELKRMFPNNKKIHYKMSRKYLGQLRKKFGILGQKVNVEVEDNKKHQIASTIITYMLDLERLNKKEITKFKKLNNSQIVEAANLKKTKKRKSAPKSKQLGLGYIPENQREGYNENNNQLQLYTPQQGRPNPSRQPLLAPPPPPPVPKKPSRLQRRRPKMFDRQPGERRIIRLPSNRISKRVYKSQLRKDIQNIANNITFKGTRNKIWKIANKEEKPLENIRKIINDNKKYDFDSLIRIEKNNIQSLENSLKKLNGETREIVDKLIDDLKDNDNKELEYMENAGETKTNNIHEEIATFYRCSLRYQPRLDCLLYLTGEKSYNTAVKSRGWLKKKLRSIGMGLEKIKPFYYKKGFIKAAIRYGDILEGKEESDLNLENEDDSEDEIDEEIDTQYIMRKETCDEIGSTLLNNRYCIPKLNELPEFKKCGTVVKNNGVPITRYDYNQNVVDPGIFKFYYFDMIYIYFQKDFKDNKDRKINRTKCHKYIQEQSRKDIQNTFRIPKIIYCADLKTELKNSLIWIMESPENNGYVNLSDKNPFDVIDNIIQKTMFRNLNNTEQCFIDQFNTSKIFDIFENQPKLIYTLLTLWISNSANKHIKKFLYDLFQDLNLIHEKNFFLTDGIYEDCIWWEYDNDFNMYRFMFVDTKRGKCLGNSYYSKMKRNYSRKAEVIDRKRIEKELKRGKENLYFLENLLLNSTDARRMTEFVKSEYIRFFIDQYLKANNHVIEDEPLPPEVLKKIKSKETYL